VSLAHHRMLKNTTLAALAMLLLIAFLGGCGSIPAFTSKNKVYDPNAKLVDRANLENWGASNVFVGVAISGGGMRAANFSAAVLEELEKHGFLKHVSAISSVSGGSLTAAYFALQRQSQNWPEFYGKLREDLESKAWCRYLLCVPLSLWNLILTGLTHYDRSDLMAGVFDDVFFNGANFDKLGDKGPKLLINATSLTLGSSAPFLDSNFREKLYSRLDTFPISQAVMASGAFPGAFSNVTLTNFWGYFEVKDDAHSLLQKMKTLNDLNDPDLAIFRQSTDVLDSSLDSSSERYSSPIAWPSSLKNYARTGSHLLRLERSWRDGLGQLFDFLPLTSICLMVARQTTGAWIISCLQQKNLAKPNKSGEDVSFSSLTPLQIGLLMTKSSKQTRGSLLTF
jgi:Patatin-like phospholipase